MLKSIEDIRSHFVCHLIKLAVLLMYVVHNMPKQGAFTIIYLLHSLGKNKNDLI